MVLGLFDGSIDVATDRPSYLRGDTINCSCTLKLQEPIDARELRVLFQRIEGIGKYTEYTELAEFSLDSERTYRDGEHFEFALPVDEKAAPEFVKFGGLAGFIQSIATQRRVRWEIRVSLDRPMELDVSGHVYPAISRPVVQK